VAPEALEYILHLDTPIETVKSVLIADADGKHPPVLSRVYVESLIEGQSSEIIQEVETDVAMDEQETESPDTPPPLLVTDDETGWSFRVEKNPSPEQVGSEGLVEDFLALFRDRFNRIKRIYMSRIDTQNAVSPFTAKLRKDSAKARKAMNREGMRTASRTTQIVFGAVRN
jgi:DNA polymerase II small subunit/DNA polymerase delta subunit B